MTFHRLLLSLGLVALFGLAAIAKTPDGQTPAEEEVCDEVSNSLFGLCNAYCEAMDCDDSDTHASDAACESVLANYHKKSDGEDPPCLDDGGDDTGDPGGPLPPPNG
jgi:hypothetical protein